MAPFLTASQRVLFFVGPDMCGKTQIARDVAAALDIPYFKASSEHETYASPQNFLMQLRYADPRTFDLVKQTGMSLVFDRGYPCEAVYSQVFDRPTDEVQLRNIDGAWASLGAVIIMCHRSSYAGIVDDLDASIDAVKLARIEEVYREWLKTTACRHMIINVDDEDLDRETDDVLAFLGGLK